MRKESELMQAVLQRSENGEKDLQAFILNKSPKTISDLQTWKMQPAQETVAHQHCTRIAIIRNHAAGECAANCQGEWLKCEKEVLQNNKTKVFFFACALRNAFLKGRLKNTNFLIILSNSPTNCGKSFLLNRIEIMIKAFVNLANGRYSSVGLDECKVAYLNNFRRIIEIIAWSYFLLLLEGLTVHLPQPKNQYATDMCIQRENTIPYFATSREPIELIGKYNIRDERESIMMSPRWHTLNVTHQIENAKIIDPCTGSFSQLVLVGAEEDDDIKSLTLPLF